MTAEGMNVTSFREQIQADALRAARIEEQLSDVITQAGSEVAHAESFDDEQRAEIYSILQAMRAETQLHRAVVGRWVSDRPGSTGDA